MKESMIKELVEMAMSSFKKGYFDRDGFLKQLKGPRYHDRRTILYITGQIADQQKSLRPCIFIDPDNDFGFKVCPYYRKELEPGDPHLIVCEGQWTADQRWNGGGPYYGGTNKLIVGKIPTSCQGPYKPSFVQRLVKAVGFHEDYKKKIEEIEIREREELENRKN